MKLKFSDIKDLQRKHYLEMLEDVYDDVQEAIMEGADLYAARARLSDLIVFVAFDSIGGISEPENTLELESYTIKFQVINLNPLTLFSVTTEKEKS